MGSPWPMKAALKSRRSAVSLKGWLDKTKIWQAYMPPIPAVFILLANETKAN